MADGKARRRRRKPEDGEAVFHLEYDAETGIAEIYALDWFTNVREINDRIASKYEFPDYEKHYEFLLDTIDVMQGPSRIEVRDGVVTVPADLTPFKTASAQFQKLMQKIDELAELIFAMQLDATTVTLLQHFDGDDTLKNFQKSIPEMVRVLVKIDSLEGTAGNRPTGDWVRDFCVHCQGFWAEHKGGGTRIIFEQARRTRISYWVEDVFLALDRCIGRNTPVSKLKTVARDVPAYRPSGEPITGDTT